MGVKLNGSRCRHEITVSIHKGVLSASVDGAKVVDVQGSCPSPGLAALGCGKYHRCSFRDFSLEKLPAALGATGNAGHQPAAPLWK